MAMPQPLFGDYNSLGAQSSSTTTQRDALSQYYDTTSTLATTHTVTDPLLAWSAPPETTATTANTMPGHATGSSAIDALARRGSSSSAKSLSPRSSTRTPSTSSNKSSRSRASTSSKSSAPSTESAAAGKRRTRSSTSTGGGDGSRRDKFLERNRVAASKCRQRKKEWVSGLEEAKDGLESHNAQLQAEYNGLLGEVSRMKNQIMAHASCHDPNIDKWIDNEARRFVQAPEPGEFPAGAGAGGVGYAGFPEAGAPPPFPMDYQFDDGSRLSPSDTALSADMPGCLKDAERPLMRPPEAVSG